MSMPHRRTARNDACEQERLLGQGQGRYTPRDYRMALVGGTIWATASLQTSRLLTGVALIALLGVAALLLIAFRRRQQGKSSGGRQWQATACLLLVISASTGMVTHHTLSQYDAHPIHAMLANTEQARCHLRLTQHPTQSPSGDYRALGVLEECSNLTHSFDTPVRILFTAHAPSTSRAGKLLTRGTHSLGNLAQGGVGPEDLSLRDLGLGESIEATGRLTPSEWASPPIVGEFALHSVHTRRPPQGLAHYTQEVRTHLHTLLAGHSPHAQALIPGLVLGDKSGLSAADTQEFRAASFSHLVVVSGFHLGILAATLSIILPGRGIFAAGVSALSMVGLLIASGAAPSTIRAFLMAVAILGGRLMGQGTQSGAALGTAVSVMILHDPWQAIHPGFALSVAATAGVIWPAQALLRHSDTPQRRRTTTPTPAKRHALIGIPSKLLSTLLTALLSALLAALWQASIVALWAQLAIIPILILAGMPYAPWGILSNVMVAPIIVPLCVGAALAALSAPFAPPVASLIVTLLEPACDWVFAVAHIAAQLPGAQIQLHPHDLLLVGAAGATYAAHRRWRVHKREVLMSNLSEGRAPTHSIHGRRSHGTATERSTDPH